VHSKRAPYHRPCSSSAVRETPDHGRAAPTTGSADAPGAVGRWRVAASGKRARRASYGFTEVQAHVHHRLRALVRRRWLETA
jgi:hypothetical protein